MVGSPVHGPVARLETARVRAPPTERGVWRENIRRSKEGGSARWPSIVHSHVGMQAMADVKVSLPRSAPHACETHAAFVPSLGARSAICTRLVLRMSSVFSVLAGERVACRVRQFYPRSRSSILSYNDRGGIRFDRYRAPSAWRSHEPGAATSRARRAREGATASDTPGPGISQVM